MEIFWEDLDSGEVYIRDKWQFALKSEFFPLKDSNPSRYTQEFYLFIPNSLQINSNTYSKQSFYLDQTNLIRYKTPEFSFEQLLDATSQRSPLTRIVALCEQSDNPYHRNELSDELKLMANVVRSTLRREVKILVFVLEALQSSSSAEDFSARCLELCSNIRKFRERYALVEAKCLENWKDPLFYKQLIYIDEFLSYSITHYLTGLLESVRLAGREDMVDVDAALCDVLLNEKQLSDSLLNNGNKSLGDNEEGETVLYRYSLLNKFVLDALHLTTNRFSLDQRYRHWIGAASAGVAIAVYFSLFLSLGNVFVINSAPFLLIMVICYILKDRMKEWLLNYYYLQATRWFPDYTTVIRSEEGKGNVGVIRESFSILDPKQLSHELNAIRNAGFHSVLETVQRAENVLFYKRVVEINAMSTNERRYGVNVIFRFNIQEFLRKAGDPTETHLTIDPKTKKLISIRLPKVYHLNLIIRSTSSEDNKVSKTELKKLKIVVDRNGIKRIEQLSRS